MLNKIILELNNIYKENNGKVLIKEEIIQQLIDKGILQQYTVKSLFNIINTNILIRFSFSKKSSKSSSNTILGFKHIINNNDEYFILSLIIYPETFEIKCINLPFIKKVSSTSVNLTKDKIVGSINYSDIKKEFNGIVNNLKNIKEIYNIYIQNRKNKELYIDNIIDNTSGIKGHIINKISITDVDIEKIIQTQKSINLSKLKNYIINKYLYGKEKKIQYIFDTIKGTQQRGTLIEELICGEDTKNNFEDLLIINKDIKIFINIKTSDIKNGNNTAPYAFNLNKLIASYIKTKEENNKFIFIFLFITNTDKGIVIHLYNFLSENLIDSYNIETRWAGRGKNSKPGIQFNGINDELLMKNANINEDKARQFLQLLK